MAREIPPSQSSGRRNGDANGHGERNGSSSNGFGHSQGPSRNGSGGSDGVSGGERSDEDEEPSRSPSPGPSKRKRESTLRDVFRKQDAAEKVRLTSRLNQLREVAEDARSNLTNLTYDDLAEHITKQNAAFVEVCDLATGAIDARTILEYTEIGSRKARQFRSDTSAFDCDGFLIKVKDILGLSRTVRDEDEDELDDDVRESRARPRGGVLGDWARIGWMANKRQRRAPGLEFMLGPLAVEYEKRVFKERQAKTVLAPVQRPEEVVQSAEKKTDDTLTYVKKVGKQLAKLDPHSEGIPFFPFFINPKSFGQSSENLFFISFLVRDGRAGLHLSGNDELIITHRQRYEEDEDEEAPGAPCQGVMEFDMETWREAIKVYNIKESKIPHREPPSGPRHMAANQWY